MHRDRRVLLLFSCDCRLRWDFGCTTVAHYVDILSGIGVVLKDDICCDRACTPEISRYANQYLVFFLRLSLMEPAFSEYTPLQQATAVVMALRKAIHVSPAWREELETILCMRREEALPCFEVLWKLFKEKYPETSKKESRASPVNVNSVSVWCVCWEDLC